MAEKDDSENEEIGEEEELGEQRATSPPRLLPCPHPYQLQLRATLARVKVWAGGGRGDARAPMALRCPDEPRRSLTRPPADLPPSTHNPHPQLTEPEARSVLPLRMSTRPRGVSASSSTARRRRRAAAARSCASRSSSAGAIGSNLEKNVAARTQKVNCHLTKHHKRSSV